MDSQKVPQLDQQGERARRPYERPRIHWEEDFLPYVFSTCGKLPGGGGKCNVAGGNS